jgi:hypothetical protein
MTIHITLNDIDLSLTATWVGPDPEPYNGDSASFAHTIRLHQGDATGPVINELNGNDVIGILADGPIAVGTLPGFGTYAIEAYTPGHGYPSSFSFIWDGTSGGTQEYELEYPPPAPEPDPVDPAQDYPFGRVPVFRAVPLDTAISLDPADVRIRVDPSVGFMYPNPTGPYFFVTINDIDRDGIYDVNGEAVGVTGYLLRTTANDQSVITDEQFPLGALTHVQTPTPHLSNVADTIAAYKNQVGITLSVVGFGVVGLAYSQNDFTITRVGTADPEPEVPTDPPVTVPPTPIPHLRHATRHVHATVLNIVREQLTTLGWTQESTLPFGPKYANVVRFIDSPAIAGDRLADGIEPGIVACTVGPEQPPDSEEIGGPLTRQDYPIFFDVFQGSYSATTALANDIRDILLGRFPGTRRHIGVIDQTDNTRVPGWTCELTDVTLVRPEIRLPLHWQVVKVTAEVYFPEVQW